MDFNITAKNAKFIVNKEKRVVVCVIERTSFMFIDFVLDNFRIGVDVDNHWNWTHRKSDKNNLREKLYMPNKFVGIAVCSPDDEWNEEIGRTIAFSRAKDNVLKSFFKRANTYVNTLDKWLNESVDIINQLGAKLEVNTEKRHNYIKSLVGEESTDVE